MKLNQMHPIQFEFQSKQIKLNQSKINLTKNTEKNTKMQKRNQDSFVIINLVHSESSPQQFRKPQNDKMNKK